MLYFLPRFSIVIAESSLEEDVVEWLGIFLNDIGEGSFGLSEVPNTRNDKDDYVDNRNRHARQVNAILRAQQTPAKTVDYPHHWIQRIKQAKLAREQRCFEIRPEKDKDQTEPQTEQ